MSFFFGGLPILALFGVFGETHSSTTLRGARVSPPPSPYKQDRAFFKKVTSWEKFLSVRKLKNQWYFRSRCIGLCVISSSRSPGLRCHPQPEDWLKVSYLYENIVVKNKGYLIGEASLLLNVWFFIIRVGEPVGAGYVGFLEPESEPVKISRLLSPSRR